MAGLDEARGVYVVVGLGGGAGVVKQREIQARREERRKEREQKRVDRAAEKSLKKALKRERMEANGVEWDSENEDQEEEDDTEEEDSESESEGEEDEEAALTKGNGRNKFGVAFSEAVDETGARVRQDSFEHCVVEVRKEDLTGFLEALSLKAVVG